MMILIRWAISMVMAAGITLGLFYFMQALIATGADLDQRVSVVKIVDATMPEIELEVVEEIDKPEPIQDDTEVVEDVPDRQVSLSDGPSLNIERASVELDTGLQLNNASISHLALISNRYIWMNNAITTYLRTLLYNCIRHNGAVHAYTYIF